MAVGANIIMKNRGNVSKTILKILGGPRTVEGFRRDCIGFKHGAPANNTATDNPPHKGFFCVNIDATAPGDLYVCTAWTADASATTWVKIN